MTIIEYIKTAGVSTLVQLLILFGPLLLIAFVMNLISRMNEKLSHQVYGAKGYLYLFGWLGTSVHELGHAFFALLFGHKITEIRFFKPDKETGTLGYVKHSYNPRNPIHQTGNFFIGIGPILMGTLVLFLLVLLLFRLNLFEISDFNFSIETIQSFDLIKLEAINFWSSMSAFTIEVLKSEITTWWKIAIFIYCLISVGSSITLSGSDVKTAFKGFLIIIVLMFLFNIATIWAGEFATTFITKLSAVLSGFYSIMIISMVVNFTFLIFLGFLFMLKRMFQQN